MEVYSPTGQPGRWREFRPGEEEGEFIATLFDVIRRPPDFPVAWAHGAAGAGGTN